MRWTDGQTPEEEKVAWRKGQAHVGPTTTLTSPHWQVTSLLGPSVCAFVSWGRASLQFGCMRGKGQQASTHDLQHLHGLPFSAGSLPIQPPSSLSSDGKWLYDDIPRNQERRSELSEVFAQNWTSSPRELPGGHEPMRVSAQPHGFGPSAWHPPLSPASDRKQKSARSQIHPQGQIPRKACQKIAVGEMIHGLAPQWAPMRSNKGQELWFLPPPDSRCPAAALLLIVPGPLSLLPNSFPRLPSPHLQGTPHYHCQINNRLFFGRGGGG